VKKHTNVAIEEPQKSKLALKKITLRDLDQPELEKVAGGIEPTTTVEPTHRATCFNTCTGAL
jgi:hypothetical protein